MRGILLAALLAGCYAVDYSPCTLRCVEGVCPAPLVCGADQLCHSGDDVTALCSTDLGSAGDGPSATLSSFALTTNGSPVDEHEHFQVGITALGSTGAPLVGYSGTPTLATDWGDLTVSSIQPFSSGATTAMVSLNRETDPAHPAHVIATDGAATGSTPDLTVKAPPWQQIDGSPIFRTSTTGWDQNIVQPSWVRWNGEHRLYYYGSSTPSATKGIGYAHSPDGITWTRYGTAPILTTSTSGWDSGYPPAKLMVQIDGTGLTGAYPANIGLTWGFARSTDGATWTRDPNGQQITYQPDCNTFNDPLAFFIDGSKQYVYFEDKNDPCFALSTDDGMTQQQLQITSGFDAQAPGAYPGVVQVLREGSVLKMWYAPSSSTTNGLYATSTDGISWVVTTAAVTAVPPETVLWNESSSRYEGLIAISGGFSRLVRP